jgi:hypothetical protein
MLEPNSAFLGGIATPLGQLGLSRQTFRSTQFHPRFAYHLYNFSKDAELKSD